MLADKLRDPPSDDFRLVVLLPAQAEERPRGHARPARRAGRTPTAARGRFLACTLCQPGPASKPVYVHAKIGIVDDGWLTIGSANLNEHSLFNDTEMNLVCRTTRVSRATVRLRLWSEHLECDPAELEGDPAQIVDERWRPQAGLDNGKLRLLPRVSRHAKGLLGPLNGFLVDG